MTAPTSHISHTSTTTHQLQATNNTQNTNKAKVLAMYILGKINNLRAAQAFSDYLSSQGIDNKLNPVDGGIEIILHNEEQATEATDELQKFVSNPSDPRYMAASWNVNNHENTKLSSSSLGQILPVEKLKQSGPITLLIMLLCVGLYAATYLLQTNAIYAWLSFPPAIDQLNSLTEPWRLLTPVFMHFGLMHIAFNSLWWLELGSMVEKSESGWQLFMLLLIIGVSSNFWQYTMTGPNFGGMSGVVYGLVGYLWFYGKINPKAGYQLQPQIVIMMLVWLVVCFVFLKDSVANWAHLGGLIIGSITGIGFGSLQRANHTSQKDD